MNSETKAGFLMDLPAQILKAAKICQAKNDFRNYLQGVYIGQKYIASTDGRKLFYHDHTIEKSIIPPKKDLIINILGTIPKKADRCSLYRVDEKFGYIEFGLTKRKQLNTVRLFVEFIDGEFPDIEKVIPTKEPSPVDKIAFNQSYIAQAEKCFSIMNSHGGGTMTFYGENSSVLISTNTNYGVVCVIVMPMRIH